MMMMMMMRKSVIMRMVTTGLAIFFQTNYSSLNPVTPSYKSPSLSTLDKLFWFSSNMKFWRWLKVLFWFNLLIRAHLSGAMRNFKCTSFLLLLGCKGENDQEDEKQLFKFKIILNFTSFSVFGSCQLQDLVENNNVEKLETTFLASSRLEIYIRTGPVEMTERNCGTN